MLPERSTEMKKNEVLLDRWNHDTNNFESDEFHETQRISEALQRNAENLAKSLTLSEKAILDQYQIGLKLDFAAEVSKMKLKSREGIYNILFIRKWPLALQVPL